MKIYTMGFAQKSAEEFFNKIKDHEIELLIDIRLNNKSQLAGFTKGRDLEYFLKEIAKCSYVHEPLFAPTKELLDDYKKDRISWDRYVEVFSEISAKRDIAGIFRKKYGSWERVLLLCSEPQPMRCHRRLVAETVAAETGAEIIHI